MHGISSKILGEKNNDPTFLSLISTFDVIGLSELHTKNIISIPGFYLKKQKFRDKKHKGPKISGGIAVYVKQNLASNFRLMPNENIDSIWLKTSLGGNNETHLGFYYCSPDDGQTEVFEIAGKEIQNFSTSNTYIFGDFNARTKTVDENVAHDKYDEIVGVENTLVSIPPSRNSEDLKVVNKRGREFLDMCRINDLTIANGRTIGDLFGRFTCHQKRGSSVVDYLLTPCQNLRNIMDFKVGEHQPLLSDHCPIAATLRLHTNLKVDSGNIPMETLPDSFIWDEDSSITFTEKLKSEEHKRTVTELMSKENLQVEDIRDFLIDVAKTSKLKTTKNKRICKRNDKPWFDNECKDIKEKILCCGKTLRSNPNCTESREKIYILKNNLKNLLKRNKFQYELSVVNEMCSNLSSGEKKKYWKLLRKLENNQDRNSYIPDFTLVNHFKELLQDEGTALPRDHESPDTGMPGKLDHLITKKELEVASKILKNGKGTGLDVLRNEMIAPLVTAYPKLLLRAFNDIITGHKTLSKDWLISLITCIHKKGAKDNPDNYRGISLMSCLGKLFLTIINNRLVKYCLDNGLLSPGQLGFVAGNRTSDPHIILQNIIQKYCHKKNQRVFACYVDFSKAFDTVPRNILMRKLREKGIDGRVLEIIKTLYFENYASVKIGKRYSPSFKTDIGVRQGCVLSPLLFNIFLADLQPLLDKCQDNVKIDENTDLSCLLWADDILMFSTSEKGLQDKLDKLDRYCQANKLTVNTDKTQCMIFNKSGRVLKNYKFTYRNTTLQCVREYKYLGFLVTPSGEIRSGLEDLRVRALKAFAKMKKALGVHFRLDINSIHIFNYMIKPILLYCSDFWGCLKKPKNNPIENLFMSFCKQLLGLRKQTHTDGVLRELGMLPISFYAIKMAVKNWERIHQKEGNILLIASHIDALSKDLPWETSIKNTFAENGLLETYLSKITGNSEEESGTLAANILFKRLADQYNQTSMENIRTSTKMKVLSLLKNSMGRETYLQDITNPRHRQAMSRLRLSGHNLEIERGRYTKTPRNERICKYCDHKGKNAVEDETHFLLNCPMFEELRAKYLPKEILDNRHMSQEQKLVKIMTNSDLKQVAKFIFEAFRHREVTLDVLNTLEDITKNVEKLIAAENQATVNKNIDVFHIKKVSSDGLKIVLTRVGPNM